MTDQAWLEAALKTLGATSGTVHRVEGDLLRLTAAVNIPESVLAVTQRIPKGKGMAGLAWQRGEPVQTCDLQADVTGDVQPGAKAVEAQEAIAIPVGDRAVVGFAFPGPAPAASADLARTLP